ncbi:GDSL-type esterase/lipase family protein [Marinitenerispora sediminis]|uniref:SGNH hydrolase-type esterase domain-containing protein n=1 Tax=Marinitenerispora sediminis TaxID=1931232 RepID=A0A368SZ24_9ACTN|nr:GDSL-type esterase/lipase family protein [Marinitenerispora sediminis]RCV47827.1 hypothetical protein DEF28_25240 [Marinitenerispora sediminis]RCV48385.1 hypothetical protein DEF23_25100 [Marinitenerispora sediminis]RCV50324.1 hypothetical protein DEF24_24330 [Marinitenerispora sediminis]
MDVRTEPIVGRGDIVLLGDSLTEGGAWQELLPGLPVRNLGVGGDTAAGVRRRLRPVAEGRPAQVFLLIGTNDVALGRDLDAIAADTAAILAELRRATPRTRLHLQSVPPRTAPYTARIRDLNARYQRAAAEHGAQYLDLWPALADAEGRLRAEFTADGLHLLPAGYRAWTGELRPRLAAAGAG